MYRRYLNLQPFYNTPDSSAGIADSLTHDEIFDSLATDDDSADSDKSDDSDKPELDLSDDADDEDDSEGSDEDSESDDDKSESEDEEDELKLDEENEDEIELAKIPTRQELKKYDPELFKKFPQLEHALFREKAYSEIYPTVAEAKESKVAVDQFNKFQHQLLSGNITDVLKTVKGTDPKAFDKIVGSFLNSIGEIDKNAHLPITGEVAKGILNYIHSAASSSLKRNENDKQAQQLQIAAELIHQALFDTTEVTPFQRSKEKEEENPEIAKFKKEREEFEKSRYVGAFNEVSERVNTRLTKAVTNEIDTKNILTPYVKKNLVNDVMSTLDKTLMADTRFRALIDKLWLKSKESNYSTESKEAINKALIEKAKTLLPGIMRAKKAEAIKGFSTKKKESGTRELSRTTNRDKGQSRTNENTRGNKEDRSKPRDDESNLDFLMRD